MTRSSRRSIRRTSTPKPQLPDAGADLSTALHCIGEFGQSIRAADAKAAALASAHGVLLSLLIGGFPGAPDLPHASWLVRGTLLSCVAASLVSAGCLLGTLLPRLKPPAGPHPSPLAIASPPKSSSPPTAQPASRGRRTVLTEQAWQQASTLASIGLVKFRWLRKATAASALTLATFLAWVVLAVVFSPRS